MGWLWSSTPSESTKDPYSKLDPALRDFLDKESPLKLSDTEHQQPAASHPQQQQRKQQAAQTPSADGPQTSYRSQIGLQIDDPESTSSSQRAVPPESLFQDGRYAHLWKTYRPQGEVEAAGQNDQDRLADVISSYQDRKAAIGRAAMENCVEYQIEEKDCFSGGLWRKGLGMCRTEARAFGRCFEMQQRFLKALGYLSSGVEGTEEERIQMHADKLYHEMLERERLAEESKKEGKEVPVLAPLLQNESTTAALGQDSAWAKVRQQAHNTGDTADLSNFAPKRQEEIRTRLKGMSEDEKALELQLLAAEARANREYSERIDERLKEEQVLRAERRERGKETVGDAIKRAWGWDREK